MSERLYRHDWRKKRKRNMDTDGPSSVHTALLLFAVIGLSSCAALDPLMGSNVGIDWSHRPADFPQLRIIEHDGPHALVRESPCMKEVGAAVQLMACAEPDFDRMTCEVWIETDVDADYVARERRHEIDGHCHGLDHPGDHCQPGTICREWQDWKHRRA